MLRLLTIAALSVIATAAQARADDVKGNYIEVRNCDVWTGPCFANADGNVTGKNAAMVWHIDEGTQDGVRLDNLTVIAVVQASNTLGMEQNGPAQAVLIVDSRASEAQKAALIKLAKAQGGDLLKNVEKIQSASIRVDICGCKGESCTEIDAGTVKVKTRCLDAKHDKACGNEIAYYPPLVAGVQATPAAADHSFTGTGLPQTWRECERRGAYVGTFAVR
jgi:hypothetical protein